jgi:hypothetical protein
LVTGVVTNAFETKITSGIHENGVMNREATGCNAKAGEWTGFAAQAEPFQK